MRLVPMSAVKPASVKSAPTLEQVLKRPVPSHIAIIMDGNGRWAERRGLCSSDLFLAKHLFQDAHEPAHFAC